MAIAEEVLNGDANNPFAHRIIVDAAHALEMPQTAVLSLETMVRISPKDKALVIEFADTVAETGGNATVAEEFLDDLIRSTPYDPDLKQAQKNLSAHKVLDEGGYNALADGSGSFRDVLRNKEEAVSLEQEKRVQKSEDVTLRLIEEYETRIITEPDNLKLLRSLAELYTQKNNFPRALALYGRIKQSDLGGDATLDRAIADTTVRQFDHQIAQLNPFEEGHADRVAALNAEKLDFQLTDCRQRAEKYPTDLAINLTWGSCIFRPARSTRPLSNFKRRRATRTSASPR